MISFWTGNQILVLQFKGVLREVRLLAVLTGFSLTVGARAQCEKQKI